MLSDAVSANFTARILDLAERAARERPSAIAERNFGVESTGEGGHRVTHLKHVALAQPAFLRELWLLSRRADAWGVTGQADARRVRLGANVGRIVLVRARALDVVAWRGWEWHRVAPVTRGVRRVLVMEWWAPAHAADEGRAGVERGADSAAGLREALARDPGSDLLRQAVQVRSQAESRSRSN